MAHWNLLSISIWTQEEELFLLPSTGSRKKHFQLQFFRRLLEIHWLLMQLSINYWFGGIGVCFDSAGQKIESVCALELSKREKFKFSNSIQFNSDASCCLQSLQPMLSFLSLKPARGSNSAVFTNKTKLKGVCWHSLDKSRSRVTLLWKVR